MLIALQKLYWSG